MLSRRKQQEGTMITDYVFKTQPYAHQLEAFELSRDKAAFALLMEMGTGKSKIIVDNAAWLYGVGRIDALVVVAPNGVHRNWIDHEVPDHLPDHIAHISGFHIAQPRKAERERLERIFTEPAHKLRIIAINIEALSTKKGTMLVRKLLNTFRCMLAVDESSRIKTPGKARTLALINLSKHAPYRRILSGTAVTQGPLDLYAQYKFLDPTITGYTTFTAFKARYAEYERRRVNNKRGFYDELVAYHNLSELTESIRPYSYRKMKKDCLDLPDKVFERYPVELSKEQRRIYSDLLHKTIIELREETGGTLFSDALSEEDELMRLLLSDNSKMEVKNSLTKLLRMQQVLGGFFAQEDGTTVPIDKTNKRIEALMHVVAETQTNVIVWARFRPEIAAIAAALREKYGKDSVVEYHGGVGNDARADAVNRFQGRRAIIDPVTHSRTGWEEIPAEQRARFFVGQPHSGGIGITLTAAQYVIYYSNDYSLETRLQSEDRAHRIGQRHNVTYVDLIAQRTIDEQILDVLLDKSKIASQVLDPLNAD